MVVAEHLATVGATLLLVVLWIAAGARLLRGLHPRHDTWPAPLSLVTSAVLGQGLTALLMLALGSVGLLRPPIVLGAVVVTLLLLRLEVASLASTARRLTLPGRLLPRVVVGGWVVLGLVMVLLALAPPWDWDTLMYHQALPLEFLRSGAIRLPPDNFHIALIGVVQLASIPLLAAGLEAGPALASVASYFLVAGALIGAARVVGDEDAGWWSALVLLGVPGFLLVATTARIDVTFAAALLIAHTLLVLAVVRRVPGTLVIAAVCFGLAGGMKVPGLAYAVACAPLALFWWKDRRTLGVSLAAFVVALGPWLLKNALLLGAPFSPLGTASRLEPWLATIAGSTSIPPGFDRSVFAQLGASRTTFNLWDAFFNPGLLTIEGEGRFYGLPLVILLFPVALLASRRIPSLLAVGLPPLLYLALIIVPLPETNLRYLFPAVLTLLLATVAGLRAAWSRQVPPLATRALIVVLVGAAALNQFPAVKERAGPRALLFRWSAGLASRGEVRARHPHGAARQIAVLEDSLARLGDDALVLLLWEARTAGLRPRAISDVRLSNWPLLSQTAAPGSCLAGTGITHVVINRASVGYYITRGASPDAFRIPQLGEFIRRCLEGAIDTQGYLIFRVRSAPLG
jgi:hypothetical protein